MRCLKRAVWLGVATLLLVGLGEGTARLLGQKPIHDVYSEPSILWRPDPLLGWSHIPGSSEVYVGPRPFPIEFRSEVSINQLGLRDDEIGPKPEDGIRILVLGDSMIAAFEVDHEQTMTSLLEKKLGYRYEAPIEVIISDRQPPARTRGAARSAHGLTRGAHEAHGSAASRTAGGGPDLGEDEVPATH